MLICFSDTLILLIPQNKEYKKVDSSRVYYKENLLFYCSFHTGYIRN